MTKHICTVFQPAIVRKLHASVCMCVPVCMQTYEGMFDVKVLLNL